MYTVYDYNLFIYCIVGKVELDLTKININLFKITWSVSLQLYLFILSFIIVTPNIKRVILLATWVLAVIKTFVCKHGNYIQVMLFYFTLKSNLYRHDEDV